MFSVQFILLNKTKETSYKIGDCMNDKTRIEKLEEEGKLMIKIMDKLEQRIATLEKVLQSHAKCIGEMREQRPLTKQQYDDTNYTLNER